jgi:phage-related protein
LTWIDRRDRFTALYYTFTTAGGVGQCFAWGNFTWQPDASASTTWWGPSENGPGCAAPSTAPYGWYESGDALEPVTYYDGRAIVSVIPTSEHTGLLYQRLDPIDLGPLDSATEDTSQPGTLISDAAMQPRVVVGDAKDSVVAVFGTEPSEADQRSVYALLRNQADGSEATSMGMIARGTDVSNVNALWDGRAFRAFYLSKVDGSHQVYTAPLQCE